MTNYIVIVQECKGSLRRGCAPAEKGSGARRRSVGSNSRILELFWLDKTFKIKFND